MNKESVKTWAKTSWSHTETEKNADDHDDDHDHVVG